MEKSRNQQQLHRLHKDIRQCRKCPLHRNRTQAVPGEGPVRAAVFFVGEAPGKNEDKKGRPFVGRSGKFLDRLPDETGIKRNDVYITSSVKCRPPNNRTPLANERIICKNAWLDRQISLVDPKIVVTSGKTASYQVSGTKQNLDSIYGLTITKDGRIYFAAYHPAAAMRFPQIKKTEAI